MWTSLEIEMMHEIMVKIKDEKLDFIPSAMVNKIIPPAVLVQLFIMYISKTLFRNQYSLNNQTIKIIRLMNGFNIGDWINEMVSVIPDFTLEIGFSYIGLLPDMSYKFVKAQRDTCKRVFNRSQWEAEEFKQIKYAELIDDYQSDEIIPLAPVTCTVWISRVSPS